MDLKGKEVLVVGAGISGISAVNMLNKLGACPILFDSNDIRENLEERNVKAAMYFKELPEEVQNKVSLVIMSPGVPTDTPFVEAFRNRKIPVWGEIELAYAFSKGDVLAITGTNGKTTTTALVGEIMKDYFDSVYVVGNIGMPYTDIALDTLDFTVTVAEISSFQLETIDQFKPAVSAILNITPDHLNRHHTMENYIWVKEQIARNQGLGETVVLNYDDSHTRDFGERANAKVMYFSRTEELEKGIFLREETIYIRTAREEIPVLNIDDMKLLGMHNVENVMAAIGIAYSYGVPVVNIAQTVKNFDAVEHRIEYVKEKYGVKYYNDSKGTNTDAAIKGIKAMNRPTILIGGGYDKQSEYDDWIEAFDGKVKYLILIGQTREKIAECARKHGFSNIILADSLKEAVEISREKASTGDAVLLSPACASWGMFKNFEERGTMFKRYVDEL